jgi:hypothetical protein
MHNVMHAHMHSPCCYSIITDSECAQLLHIKDSVSHNESVFTESQSHNSTGCTGISVLIALVVVR